MGLEVKKWFVKLKPGEKVISKHVIAPARVANLKYASECPSAFSPIPKGSKLDIIEKRNDRIEPWVILLVPYSHGTMTFKFSAEELTLLFNW